MVKIRRIEKLKKHKSIREELAEEGAREVHGLLSIFPLFNRKKKKS